ncbi:MAG TPA: thioredoxin domain-containing protein [Candidatus Binataceae bacterium]|nr:thioredoxin domain-containing protein [Candidatus Binataceae bacterium]
MLKQVKHTATVSTPVRPGGCIFVATALTASITAVAVLVLALAVPARATGAADSGPVLAEVGNHKITQPEVDAKIKIKLYDARKEALDQMVDDYLLQQAAKKDKLSVADYLKREVTDKAAASVTDATAKKFYDENKDKIPALKSAGSYDKIKDRLIAALRQRDVQRDQEELMARLRKEGNAKILLEPPRISVNLSESSHPTLGSKDATVKVIEFADFQCPYCKRSEEAVKTIREKYGDRIELVFMDFPLSFHANAMPAANAARCANAQGKFWPYHDALFADQSKLDPASLKATAKKLGLDSAKFDACFDKNQYSAAIQKDLEEGRRLNVNGTPTFFIDGRELVGAQPADSFTSMIDEELAKNSARGKKTASAD